MNKIVIFLLAVLVTSRSFALDESGQHVTRLSEPVLVTATGETFGSIAEISGKLLTLEGLIRESDAYADKEVFVKTRIDQVCQKKGCFFIARSGNDIVRITFIDYSFFIPADSAGKEVVLAGKFSRSVISEAQAKHYAGDTGQKTENINGDQFEYSIVATSVTIPKSGN